VQLGSYLSSAKRLQISDVVTRIMSRSSNKIKRRNRN